MEIEPGTFILSKREGRLMSAISVRLAPRQSYNGGKLCIPSPGSNVSRNVLSELYLEIPIYDA